jgi:hypothetical protein
MRMAVIVAAAMRVAVSAAGDALSAGVCVSNAGDAHALLQHKERQNACEHQQPDSHLIAMIMIVTVIVVVVMVVVVAVVVAALFFGSAAAAVVRMSMTVAVLVAEFIVRIVRMSVTMAVPMAVIVIVIVTVLLLPFFCPPHRHTHSRTAISRVRRDCEERSGTENAAHCTLQRTRSGQSIDWFGGCHWRAAARAFANRRRGVHLSERQPVGRSLQSTRRCRRDGRGCRRVRVRVQRVRDQMEQRIAEQSAHRKAHEHFQAHRTDQTAATAPVTPINHHNHRVSTTPTNEQVERGRRGDSLPTPKEGDEEQDQNRKRTDRLHIARDTIARPHDMTVRTSNCSHQPAALCE